MSLKMRQAILVLGDIALAFLALVLAVRIGFWNEFSWLVLEKHILPFALLYLGCFIAFYVFGLYDLGLIKPKTELIIRTGQCFLFCFAIAIVLFYFVPFFGITPKTNLVIDFVIFALLAITWRRIFFRFFSAFYFRRAVFLGKNRLALNLIKAIEKDPQFGYKFCGFLEQKQPLLRQIKAKKIDVLIIAEDIEKNKKIIEELYRALPLKIKFLDLAQAYELILQKIPVDFVSQAWFLENLREYEKKAYDKIKRIGDIIAALFFLIVGSPLWVLSAILIKYEDKGRIFYKQKRMGKNRRDFWLIKFRSLKENAEENGPVWAQNQDSRATKVGKFLRTLHFDELPQMLNILKGDISLVGPRPERPEFVKILEKQIPHYHLRHLIKSGFTGWAQIKFRYARTIDDSHEKFEYDLYYIKNRSLFLDLGILLKSFQLLFKKES